MSKGSEKVPVSTHYMSLLMGICLGPVDSIKAFIYGEKKAFEGDITANAQVPISKPNLFGGYSKEGGLKGVMEVYLGGADQLVSPELAARLGIADPADCPAFRGMTTVFFRGASRRGFYWAAGNPYLKTLWFQVKSIPRGLGIGAAEIVQPSGLVDANPAHIIYECMTNQDWGMGAAPSDIDVSSFLSVAATLQAEGFGLSMLWNQAGAVESFINEVIGHINGAIFPNPRTGKTTLRLLRNDYDVATLREITPDVATIVSFNRKAWGETVNEMKVTWTNPSNEQEESVYSQDLGNISMQGSVVSDSRNYFGIRSKDLAQKVCDRELRVACAPLCSMEVTCDRKFWDVTPLECVKVTWPEYGISGLVMRVMKVSYGRTGDSAIKLSLVEDVFSLPTVAFVAPPGTSWVDPAVNAEDITQARLMPLPAYMLVKEGGDLTSYDYPETGVTVLAANPLTTLTASFDVMLQQYTPSGGTDWVTDSTQVPFVGRALLTLPLVPEVSSSMVPLTGSNGAVLSADTFLLIGNDATPMDQMELALVTARDPLTGISTVRRGILDTIPKQWAAGTVVWAFQMDDLQALGRVFTDGETLQAKLLTNTTVDQTPIVSAPIFSEVVGARAVLPLRPANVTINGVLWPMVIEDLDSTLDITWARRNRLLEDNVVLAWNEADVAPEAGTTYTLQLYRVDTNALVAETTGITGTSAAIASPYSGMIRLRLTAVRGGLESFQPFEHTFDYLSSDFFITEDGETFTTEDGDVLRLES